MTGSSVRFTGSFEWIKLIHSDVPNLNPAIRALYRGFTDDTVAELWEIPEDLVRDVSVIADRYTKGDAHPSTSPSRLDWLAGTANNRR